MSEVKKKTVLILGATGMLGSAIYGVLKDKYRLILSGRSTDHFPHLIRTYGTSLEASFVHFDVKRLYQEYLEKSTFYFSDFVEQRGHVDFVINAIGVTIPYAAKDPALTLFVNGALPYILARQYGSKLIHITTDCVYDGVKGNYNELSPLSPVDLYGLSKSLGEPTNCVTLRTSIIGRELHGFQGLLEWFLQQSGKTITGFRNHFWNGITTKQFGIICDRHMDKWIFANGIRHIHSDAVSKFDMLMAFREKYNVDCEIISDYDKKLDRTLSSVYIPYPLIPPTFKEMIEDL